MIVISSYVCRGKEFRTEYSCLSEICSLIPQNVNMMALTATASDATIRDIACDVGMHSPILVEVCPDKQKLFFGLRKVKGLRETFTSLVMYLKARRLEFSHTIIFCQRQVECGNLYDLFLQEVGSEFTEPIGAHYSLPQYRLVNVYTKDTEEYIKSSVLAQCMHRCKLLFKVIICTATFGMSLDCIGVNRVIYYGPPNDVETYIQQTGR